MRARKAFLDPAILAGLLPVLSVFCPPLIAQERVEEENATRGVHVESAEDDDSSPYYSRRHALVIGIDDYHDPEFPDLSRAEEDARGVARVLAQDLGFAEDAIHLIVGKDATKDAVEWGLEEWACNPARIGENDLLVVYFAGHGVTRDLGRRGKRGFLVPVDGRSDPARGHSWSSLIGMSDLENVSEAIPAKHVLFVLDCCFGGLAVLRAPVPITAGLRSRARQVLTAGSAEQEVLDTGGAKHSIFTQAVIDGIRFAADVDKDRVVTFGELYHYVGRTVELRTQGRQTPLQSTLPDHEGGCVALFAPGVKPRGVLTITERLAALEQTAEEALRDLQGFSDALVVLQLLEETDELWPQREHRVPALLKWLSRARDVHGRLFQQKALKQRVRQETYLKQVLEGVVKQDEASEPIWDQADPLLQWKFETLESLIANLGVLEARIAEIEGRLDTARTIVARTVEEPKTAWDEAIRDIASSEVYRGLTLPPQVGLIPLGKDPQSGLREFYLPESGERPVRNPETGLLELTEASGLVLVLIPPGSFSMGAVWKHDPGLSKIEQSASDVEAPIHEVTLEAFFLSKYEMSQGQWQRITGENPSIYRAGREQDGQRFTLLHPIENVSWDRCKKVLARLELDFPTEAQWEYAARAGTTTSWWTGDKFLSLRGAANLPDLTATRAGMKWFTLRYADRFDDGWIYHAPVSSFLPNAFGLYNVHGNVFEWCRDTFGGYEKPVRPGDGERQVQPDGSRTMRGGSFIHALWESRSSFRIAQTEPSCDGSYGVRPARPVVR